MGNRAYLTLGETTDLFEANNTLPTFWLLGFAEEQLASLKEQILQATAWMETPTTEEHDLVFQWQQDLPTYCQLLDKHAAYIARCYPHLVPLYQWFQTVVQKEQTLTPDIPVTIYYGEILNFYEEPMQFYCEVLQLYQGIANHQVTNWIDATDIQASTIGCDQYSTHHSPKFTASQPDLLAQLEQWEQETKPSQAQSLPWWKRWLNLK